MKIENMKNIRKDRGLTQRELARRMGTSQARVSSIETGLNVSPTLAQKYADCLMCDVADLRTPDEPTVTFRVSELPAEVLEFLNSRFRVYRGGGGRSEQPRQGEEVR